MHPNDIAGQLTCLLALFATGTTASSCGVGKKDVGVICQPNDPNNERSLVFDADSVKLFTNKGPGSDTCGHPGALASWQASKTVEQSEGMYVTYVVNVYGTIDGTDWYVCAASPSGNNFPPTPGSSPTGWYCDCL